MKILKTKTINILIKVEPHWPDWTQIYSHIATYFLKSSAILYFLFFHCLIITLNYFNSEMKQFQFLASNFFIVLLIFFLTFLFTGVAVTKKLLTELETAFHIPEDCLSWILP